MTSLRGTKQSRLSRLYLDCFVPTNDKLKNIPLPPSKGEFRKLVNFSMFEKSIFLRGLAMTGLRVSSL